MAWLIVSLSFLGGCGDPAGDPDTPGGGERRDDAGMLEESGPVIVFLGDSITAGYGIDPAQAYPARIEERLREAGVAATVVNAGLSGETTSAGLKRLDWMLARRRIDVLVIALGGNDGLRGVPAGVVRSNLEEMIERTRAAAPDCRILLAGMQSPPNMGGGYASAFRAVFPEVAEEHDVALLPFLLEDVGGEPDMNLPDGIHPNPAGHAKIADHMWTALEDLGAW